jgi:quercetin dioxygenase-like cupin family protein
MVIDEPKVQVVHVTCATGCIEPPGPHPYDVVLVPLNQASMSVSIDGKPVKWRFGEPIFIHRGVQHEISNKGHEAAELLSIRIL